MSRRRSLQARIDDYLAERRRQGFRLRSGDAFLSRFARFVAAKRKRSARGVVATPRVLRYPSAAEPFRSAASTAEA